MTLPTVSYAQQLEEGKHLGSVSVDRNNIREIPKIMQAEKVELEQCKLHFL